MKQANPNQRLLRHKRVRGRISGTAKIPRLSVYRSEKYLYVQLIDDQKRITLLGLSDRGLRDKQRLNRANNLGKIVVDKLLKLQIKNIVFDRGGYAYHWRIKALAESLREGGLKF